MKKALFQKKTDNESPRKRSKIRLILGCVLVALVLVFSLIVLINMRQRVGAASGAEQDLLWRGLQDDYIFCICLLIVSLGIAFGIAPSRRSTAMRIVGGVIWCIALVVVVETGWLAAKTIIHSGQQEIAPEAKHVVVVGSALTEKDKQPTPMLEDRLDTAADWWKGHQDDSLIVCRATESVVETFYGGSIEKKESKVKNTMPGRKSRKGTTPETVLTTHITDRGVPASSVIMETDSTNAEEAFEKVLGLKELYAGTELDTKVDLDITTDTPIVIVTNGCFMNDTIRQARKAGFTNISRLPAPSTFGDYLSSFLWETWLENDPVLKASIE